MSARTLHHRCSILRIARRLRREGYPRSYLRKWLRSVQILRTECERGWLIDEKNYLKNIKHNTRSAA